MPGLACNGTSSTTKTINGKIKEMKGDLYMIFIGLKELIVG